MTDDTAKRNLANAVVQAVARGGRVESQTEEQAIIVYESVHWPKMILVICFTWVGWIFYRPKKHKRQVIRIDEFGNVLVSDI